MRATRSPRRRHKVATPSCLDRWLERGSARWRIVGLCTWDIIVGWRQERWARLRNIHLVRARAPPLVARSGTEAGTGAAILQASQTREGGMRGQLGFDEMQEAPREAVSV